MINPFKYIKRIQMRSQINIVINRKYKLVAILTIFSFGACTNHNHRTRTVNIEDNHKTVKIEDDGNTMRIRAEINNTREPIDYDRSFDVKAMNEGQKEKLKNQILDSLYRIR